MNELSLLANRIKLAVISFMKNLIPSHSFSKNFNEKNLPNWCCQQTFFG